MSRPSPEEYNPSFAPYIALTKFETVGELITGYSEQLIQYINRLPDTKADYAYAPGKWTVKEVIQHIIDMERVFAYRSLTIARGDQQALPGADHDLFYLHQRSKARPFDDLKEEFTAMRYDHNILFRSFDGEALAATGSVLGNLTTCKSWIYASFGHGLHHVGILKDRYDIK